MKYDTVGALLLVLFFQNNNNNKYDTFCAMLLVHS